MKEKIEKLLKDHQLFHSEFQIENFIIRSQGCAWAQYKQCLREIASRYESMQQIKEDIVLKNLEVRRLKNKFAIKKSTRLKNNILINRSKRQLNSMKKNLVDTDRELIQFVRIAETIKLNFWGNGRLSKEKKRLLEQNMWIEKAKFLMAVDLMTIGNLSKPTIELIYSMPKSDKKELLNFLGKDNREKLISWVMK